jgi:hypothetical protein
MEFFFEALGAYLGTWAFGALALEILVFGIANAGFKDRRPGVSLAISLMTFAVLFSASVRLIVRGSWLFGYGAYASEADRLSAGASATEYSWYAVAMFFLVTLAIWLLARFLLQKGGSGLLHLGVPLLCFLSMLWFYSAFIRVHFL